MPALKPASPGRLSRFGWPLFAVAGGLIWATSFAAVSRPFLSWLTLVPVFFLLGHRRAGLLGWLYGIAFWCASIPWIVPVLESYGGLSRWIALPLFVLLAAYFGLYMAVFARLGSLFWKRRGSLLVLAGLPALWVVLEWLRARVLLAFPWNLAGYSWVDVAGALSLASWLGVYGLSFLVVLTGAGIARGIARRSPLPAATGVLCALLLLGVGGRWGGVPGAAPTPDQILHRSKGMTLNGGGPGGEVALLQPNIEIQLNPEAETVMADYAKVVEMSRQACRPGTLLIWPESAGWPFLYETVSPLRRDVATLTAQGCSVLLNSVHRLDDSVFNSAYLVTPEDGTGRYDKRHLVPFGEYVPLAGVFSFVDTLARNAGDFAAGREVSLLSWGGEKMGAAICFEVIFPAEVAETVNQGATLLVTVTNDGWYGDTAAPWQHFRAVRFRAAENRRTLLRAALTGISAVVRSDGSVQQQLGPFEEGILRAEVAGRSDRTFYGRRPRLTPSLCWLILFFAIVFALRSRR